MLCRTCCCDFTVWHCSVFVSPIWTRSKEVWSPMSRWHLVSWLSCSTSFRFCSFLTHLGVNFGHKESNLLLMQMQVCFVNWKQPRWCFLCYHFSFWPPWWTQDLLLPYFHFSGPLISWRLVERFWILRLFLTSQFFPEIRSSFAILRKSRWVDIFVSHLIKYIMHICIFVPSHHSHFRMNI